MAYSPINRDYRYVLNSHGVFYVSSDRGTTGLPQPTGAQDHTIFTGMP
jgi:hypothetical protein